MGQKVTSNKWIKNKILIVFRVNDRFENLFLVGSQEEIDVINETIYPFPFYSRIYEGKLSLSENYSFSREGDKYLFLEETSEKKRFGKLRRMIFPSKKNIEKIEEIFGIKELKT